MKYFIVRYVHTDFDGWEKQLVPHLSYLKDRISEGSLLMSGPLQDSKESEKEAVLVFKAEDRESLQHLIEGDPYWKEGLVADYVVREWNPMFGLLGYSAEQMEAGLAQRVGRQGE